MIHTTHGIGDSATSSAKNIAGPPVLRSTSDRIAQTLLFEATALLVAVPLYSAFTGAQHGESAIVLIVLAVVVSAWTAIHNAVFDLCEWRVSGRVASERPTALRLVHAISQELTAVFVTVPLLIIYGGLGLQDALLADIGLSVIYAVYTVAFFKIYDLFRPLSTTKEPVLS